MNPFAEHQAGLTRRHFFRRATVGSAALASLLQADGYASESTIAHFAPKAKRVFDIQESAELAGPPSIQ